MAIEFRSQSISMRYFVMFFLSNWINTLVSYEFWYAVQAIFEITDVILFVEYFQHSMWYTERLHHKNAPTQTQNGYLLDAQEAHQNAKPLRYCFVFSKNQFICWWTWAAWTSSCLQNEWAQSRRISFF